ncbi:MAG: PIG-L family deacetylase [Chloroflexi bacterium]|nr:PIG-L family deacetylase [Chloroflexota bacterium]
MCLAAALALLVVMATADPGHRYRVAFPEGAHSFVLIRDEGWPGPAARVLVIAPHPDDETLGGEMVLRAAARAHSPAEVILMTCGDGFRAAAARAFRHRPTPADMLALGRLRQRETLHAMRSLGLTDSQVTFLGFPDGGLLSLWSSNWDKTDPLISATTRVNRCPYPNAVTPGAPYSGQTLLEELEAQIAAFRPTDIYLPHAWDYHPDHAATNYFVVTALHALDSDPFVRRVRLHAYLVHCGDDYPMPRAYRPLFYIDPPDELRNNGLTWSELRLTRGQTIYRLHLIDLYASQVALTRPFLESFARRNVLFGAVPRFRPRSVDWTSAAPHWTTRDSFYRRPDRHDSNAVILESMVWRPQGLLLRIQATAPAKGTVCRVTLHPLRRSGTLLRRASENGSRVASPAQTVPAEDLDRVLTDDEGHTNVPGAERSDAGGVITLMLPRSLFHGADEAFLDVTLIHNRHLVKSAPWREIVVASHTPLPVV